MDKSIAFCGFMGCGKSTVGLLLAQQTGREFVDLDAYIEQTAGQTVSQLFQQHGEAHFRMLEMRCLQDLTSKKGIVLALGGGAVLAEENRVLLKEFYTVVWLEVPFDILQARAGTDPARPLSGDGFYERYTARLPLYRAAADIIIAGDLSPAETVKRILNELGETQV